MCEELQLHTAVSDTEEKRSDISLKQGLNMYSLYLYEKAIWKVIHEQMRGAHFWLLKGQIWPRAFAPSLH